MRRVFLAIGTVVVMGIGVGLSAHSADTDAYHDLGDCLDQTDPVGFCEWSCVMVGHDGATSCCNNWCYCID